MKNFKRITKRGLSLFIALVMCMSVMSLTAFAEDDVTGEPEIAAEQVTEPAEVETQDPVEVVEPVEDEEPAEDPTPVEDEAPVEEPAETEEPVEDAEPVEDEAPAETEEPAEAEEPVEEEKPAEAATIPTITLLSVTPGTTKGEDAAGNQTITIPVGTLLSDCIFTVTTSEEVTFEVTKNPADGELYVSSVGDNSVSLNFCLTVYDPQNRKDVDLRDSRYSLTLKHTDTNTWSGSFADADMTVDGLAALLPGGEATVSAGIMNGTSQARVLLANRNVNDTIFVLCQPDAAVCTLTFMAGEEAQYVWKLPSGYDLETLPTLPGGFVGWYNSDSFDTAELKNISVSGDMTVYAKPETVVETGFLEKLENGENVTITDLTDWEIFAANSSKAKAGQLVSLGANIDCGGKTYASLSFAGNFNGNNHTISNAKFSEVASNYNSSSETGIYCSGMFASIGPGQIIANLKLKDIAAQNSRTYAGILAGLVDGSGSRRALIQNIQVTGGSASGRSAAGITGFLRNATVQYCSSKDTKITGIANGGGIVGINNALVSNCYSTTTPTAFSFMGGTAGGITGKNVRGGRFEYCWSTMADLLGGADNGGTNTNILFVENDTEVIDYEEAGFTTDAWILGNGATTHFNETEVTYPFNQ